MRSRNRWTWFLGLAVLVGALALVAAGCGGGGKKSNSSTASTGTSTAAAAAARAARRSSPSSTSSTTPAPTTSTPVLSYTVQGWGAMWHVYLPLLTYKDVAGPQGATVVPALAEALPTVTNGGKTYKLKLRSGLKYSDGKPVKASDFKYAIKRLFQIDSPGVGFFTDIVGADQFAKTKKGDISGIVTNDQTGDITVNLTAPRGDFSNILATTFAALVPAGTPAKDQSTHPIPSTGPYMIQSYQPNKQFVLVRNPQYKQIEGLPAGNPDKVVFKIVEDDAAALQQVINGQGDWDFHPIPTDRLASTQQKYGDRLKIYTPANTYYFFMNTRVKPFTDLKVRQAVNYAIDRQALVRIYGGLATPTQNVLPPTYPQYKKINMYTHDLAKAKQLVQQSGMAGMKVTVWGSNRATSKAPVEYLHRRPEQDRVQGDAEDHRRLDLLDDGRQPGDEGADRLRRLVPGLSAPARLVRRAAERRPDHPDAQQQLLERGRRGDQQEDRRAEAQAVARRRDERPVGAGRSDGRPERALGSVREPAVHRLLLGVGSTRAATSTTCSTSSTTRRSARRASARASDRSVTRGAARRPSSFRHGFRVGVVGDAAWRDGGVDEHRACGPAETPANRRRLSLVPETGAQVDSAVSRG